MLPSDPEAAHAKVREQLVAAAGDHGHWRGRLSSSALATAVAVAALARNAVPGDAGRVVDGLRWLADTAREDGGWGDTPDSPSNLSTTLLVWSAFGVAPAQTPQFAETDAGARTWLRDHLGSLEPEHLIRSILDAYGSDRSFSVPIVTMAMLCGRLSDSWRSIPQLPFELAALPTSVFRWVRMPVVSYAIPALVAIGLVRHHHAPSRFPFLRWLRTRVTPGLLEKLTAMQPSGGGYLEAIPLTAFVAMSLAACGRSHHPVTTQGLEFLRRSQRADGSWPIDTDLATWVSTRAVEALVPADRGHEMCLPTGQQEDLSKWFLAQQTTDRHPFTGAKAGGWAWTDAPGGVPDADDTAGALIALHRLGRPSATTRNAAEAAVTWLLELQNSDGGMPTFCRGWGKLPFDRSCPDITAHALRAWTIWRPELSGRLDKQIDRAVQKGLRFLSADQSEDGSWTPLWFGNQARADNTNPVYGTSLVLDALCQPELTEQPGVDRLRIRARRWLQSQQNNDGGWGDDGHGGSTIEETSLALACLARCGALETVLRGADWVVAAVESENLQPTPIGLYFARLWYSEDLYPLLYATRSLRRTKERLASSVGKVGVA